MEEKIILKNNLRKYRDIKGYTQSELAKIVGVSRITISNIENCQFSPTAKLAYVLCLALDTTFEEMFYFD
ncbi:putative transcriptional regulator [Lachnospiraceae bacterium PF1-21]|uniref:Helix-turn-helix transcriptional regulator n=1 Tax=Ohessyouella blattaphilus TaxID=2949333 RepID=A0ABT1ELG8_9FIRM|nr:helix-turn-helix transcriptional regulator [Ohessyouella blattaphilus]MCP1111551.1 helix-turn-helix transcriptional regulator [Ohessyouella blattaphilus]MCR8564945.1 helix-turn-helix transcriptional regulator [Ohessyouella blattaphilus]